MATPRLSLLSLIWIPFVITICSSCSQRDTTDLPHEVIQLGSEFPVRDIFYQGSKIAMAVGGQQFKNGFIAESMNDWDNHQVMEFGGDVLNAVHCDHNDNCIAAGFFSKLILKPEGGIWFPRFLPEQLRLSDVCPIGNGEFLLVGGHSLDFGILQVIDSTGSVTDVDTTWLHEFECAVITGSNRIHVGGYGIIMHKELSQIQWTINKVQGDFYVNMCFPTEQIGYAVGEFGSILRTDDFGDSWELLLNGNSLFSESIRLKDVAFENEYKGVVVGSGGLVWVTEDSGERWQEVTNLPGIDYHCIVYHNDMYILGGEGGLLVKMTY